MLLAGPSRLLWHPLSDEDRSLVRSELAEILKTPHFTSSKRYPALLRYVVEKTLDGQADQLKERTLGIEVFQRQPDYDTNNDTIVRFTAGEVRKRLALFYHESALDRPLQIVLPAGSYVPEFYQVLPHEPALAVPAQAIERKLATFVSTLPPSRSARHRLPLLFILGPVLLAASVLFFLHVQNVRHQTALDRFWQPIGGSSSPVLICPGTVIFSPTRLSGTAPADKTNEYPFVSMETAAALARISDLLGGRQISYVVQPTPATTLTQLREHPVILIGAYTNEWTLRLVNDLRYRFSLQPIQQIYDATNPSIYWSRPSSMPFRGRDDFGLIVRFRDKLTDNFVIVVAGLGRNGTEAAAQFVTSPRYLEQLDHRLPKGWPSKSIEIVLKTNVVDSKTGAPSIEAVHVW